MCRAPLAFGNGEQPCASNSCCTRASLAVLHNRDSPQLPVMVPPIVVALDHNRPSLQKQPFLQQPFITTSLLHNTRLSQQPFIATALHYHANTTPVLSTLSKRQIFTWFLWWRACIFCHIIQLPLLLPCPHEGSSAYHLLHIAIETCCEAKRCQLAINHVMCR